MAKCIVLISQSAYSSEHDALLRNILAQEPDFFSTVGVDCARWEEAMDWLLVDFEVKDEEDRIFCNTTSHPNETEEEVIAFANQWCDLKGWDRDVAVVKI